MTDEQFRELHQLLLDLRMRVAELELHLRRQDEIASHRQNLIYEWCAPPNDPQAVERNHSLPPEPREDFLPSAKR